MNGSNLNHGFARIAPPFVVLAQASIAADPSKGSFDNPPIRKQHKAFGAPRTRDDVQGVLPMRLDPVRQVVSSVGTVGPQQFQSRELAGSYPLQDHAGRLA